jgi:prolyl-tRNA synthetase
MNLDEVVVNVLVLLDKIQKNIYQKAFNFREQMTTRVDTFDDFKKVLDEKAGFVLAHWDGKQETEAKIK